MERDSETKQSHIHLISAMVNKLIADGWKVSADHIGYPNGSPPQFNNFVPDIYAKKGSKEIIIEAETCDSLSDETRVKWTALSSNKNIEFSLIIPKKCVDKAKELAKKWNIQVKDFWHMEI